MKTLLICALFLSTSTASFAASVCTMSLPGICGSEVTVNCDGKELRAYTYKNCADNSPSQRTLTLKKLLDQNYKIAAHAVYSGDGGEVYTLTK